MTSPKRRLAALLAAVALIAAACGGSSTDDAAPAAGADAVPANGSAASVLDITAPAADGSTIDLSTYAGQDLMLWFWAPW